MYKKLLAVLLCLCLAVTGCAAAIPETSEPLSITGLMLDTVVTITLYDGQRQQTLNGTLDVIEEYENMLSKTIEGSDVWNINHADGQPVTVNNRTAELIGIALKYCAMTDGAFDITIGHVSNLWDFKSERPAVPSEEAIAAAVKTVDYTCVQLNGNTVTLLNPDAEIDLGAIAKGYIADRIVDYLQSQGVSSAIINLGGNVVAMGSKGGSDWTVGLQDPFGRAQSPVAAVQLQNKSVVTSGIYERYFIAEDGMFYHHILDPQTGWPVNNELTSVTIISDHSVDGDALSTSCYVLGLEKGLELIQGIDGIEAIFIDDEENAYATSGVGGENGIPYLTLEDLS